MSIVHHQKNYEANCACVHPGYTWLLARLALRITVSTVLSPDCQFFLMVGNRVKLLIHNMVICVMWNSKTSMARTPLEPWKYVQNGKFELMGVNHSTRSGGKIRIIFQFSLHEGMLYVLIRIASLRRFQLKHTIYDYQLNKRAKRPWIAHLSIQAKSQTFNFEIWVTFDQNQRMTLTFDTDSTSLTHWVECFKQLWDLRLQQFPKK